MSDVPISGDAPQESDAEVFHRYFPAGRIEPITELPEAFIAEVKPYAEYDDQSVFDYKKFQEVSRISHDDGSTTFVARYAIDQMLDGAPLNPQNIFLVDIDKNGETVGSGYVASNNHPLYKGKPFVGYTDTKSGFEKQGLGRRRLFVMNALSQMSYRLPLHSGLSPSAPATRIWDSLVTEGIAIKSPQGIQNGYVFLPK